MALGERIARKEFSVSLQQIATLLWQHKVWLKTVQQHYNELFIFLSRCCLVIAVQTLTACFNIKLNATVYSVQWCAFLPLFPVSVYLYGEVLFYLTTR